MGNKPARRNTISERNQPMIKALISSAFLLTCAATPAGAACTQANLAGTWTAYSIGLNGSQLAWVSCNLVIGPLGAFIGASSSCAASGETVKVKGALRLSAPAKCAFSGSLTILPARGTNPIPSLTLSLDKQTAAGVGGANGSGNVFTFLMVRTK